MDPTSDAPQRTAKQMSETVYRKSPNLASGLADQFAAGRPPKPLITVSGKPSTSATAGPPVPTPTSPRKVLETLASDIGDLLDFVGVVCICMARASCAGNYRMQTVHVYASAPIRMIHRLQQAWLQRWFLVNHSGTMVRF